MTSANQTKPKRFEGAREVLRSIAYGTTDGTTDGKLTDSRQARWLFQAIGQGWLNMDMTITDAGRAELASDKRAKPQ